MPVPFQLCCGSDQPRTPRENLDATWQLPVIPAEVTQLPVIPEENLDATWQLPAIPVEVTQLPVIPAEVAGRTSGVDFEAVLESTFEHAKASLLIAHRCDHSGHKGIVAMESRQPGTVHLPSTTSDFLTLCQERLQLQEQLALAEMLKKTGRKDVHEVRSRLLAPQTSETSSLVIRTPSAYSVHPQSGRQSTLPDIEVLAKSMQVLTKPAVGEEHVSAPSNGNCVDGKPAAESQMKSYSTVPSSEPNSRLMLALDIVPALVILVNALVIGLSADLMQDHIMWECMELVFTMFFAGEFVVSIKLYGYRNYFLGKLFYWNWFDFFCLFTAAADVGVTFLARTTSGTGNPDFGGLMLVKMLRLARLMRLVRLLRFPIFAELQVMVQGVFSGIRVLGWAICLLSVVIFALGIVCRKLIGEDEPEFFTLPSSMFSLFRCFTEGCSAYDGTPLTERLRDQYGATFTIVYSVVYLFVMLGIFNLIMAVFIDNVSTQQHMRRLREIGESSRTMQEYVTQVLDSLYHGENTRSSSQFSSFPFLARHAGKSVSKPFLVTRQIFNKWLGKKEMMELLELIDVETASKHEIFDVLDVNIDGELSRDELVDGLMRLRGPVTKSDIVAIRMKVRHMTQLLYELEAVVRNDYEVTGHQQRGTLGTLQFGTNVS